MHADLASNARAWAELQHLAHRHALAFCADHTSPWLLLTGQEFAGGHLALYVNAGANIFRPMIVPPVDLDCRGVKTSLDARVMAVLERDETVPAIWLDGGVQSLFGGTKH